MNNERRTQNKIDIVNKIITGARLYKQTLVGRTFMYVFDNRYIETVYRTRDFAHLTGVETKLSAREFFKESIRSTLHKDQIRFSQRHPYNLCVKKVNSLINIDKISNSDLFILEDISTKSMIYKFGLTELDFSICLDYDTDDYGEVKSSYFIARSLRIDDCFNRSQKVFDVNFILSKRNDVALYTDIQYSDGTIELSSLPEDIRHKIDSGLYT